MTRATLLFATAVLASCTAARTAPPEPAREAAIGVDPLMRLHASHRVDGLESRRFSHADLWSALGPIAGRSAALEREIVGRSAEGRAIEVVRFGGGPTRVLLWSQMHGNESTATMALADLFAFLADNPAHPIARRLADRLSIEAVPMLNPDGAERFQRWNVHGVDVNRDARRLATPEARTLKSVQERFRPDFGFNLHDQNVRTTVRGSSRTAAIALLAPPFDQTRGDDPVRSRAKRVAAVIRRSLEPLVGGHVARYDDTFNPRAFGDLMQQWGVSTVLIESGGWADDPEKQHLRAVTFVAILSALDAIATGEYASADPALYETLPRNGPPLNDLLIQGGSVVLEGLAPVRVDLTVDYADPLRWTGGRIVEIGDLGDTEARDTLDATGAFIHPAPEAVREGRAALVPGAPASFILRAGADPRSEVLRGVAPDRTGGGG